jgi:hypothetical protein
MAERLDANRSAGLGERGLPRDGQGDNTGERTSEGHADGKRGGRCSARSDRSRRPGESDRAGEVHLDPVPNGLGFDGEAVSVRVTDQGSGIPADARARMFDPFFTTKANGTGLGLAVVHRAIEAHRGLVLVDSGPHGTKFTVILPRAQQAAGNGAGGGSVS